MDWKMCASLDTLHSSLLKKGSIITIPSLIIVACWLYLFEILFNFLVGPVVTRTEERSSSARTLDRGFESSLAHGCLFLVFPCCVFLCRLRICHELITRPRSPTLCRKTDGKTSRLALCSTVCDRQCTHLYTHNSFLLFRHGYVNVQKQVSLVTTVTVNWCFGTGKHIDAGCLLDY
jgi:hypothetical protein